jgi:hypothetical protein
LHKKKKRNRTSSETKEPIQNLPSKERGKIFREDNIAPTIEPSNK